AAGWRLELPASNKQAIKDFCVAVMLTDPCSEVDQAVQDEIGKVAEFLASRGADVSYTARPDFSTAEAFETYIALLRAATSGRQTDEIFAQNQAIAAGFDPADKSYYAQMTRANVMSHRDWLAVHERRT